MCATGYASALLAAGLQLGFKRDNFAKEMFDAGHVQASDREDTGKASGTRYCQQVQEPRANARRLLIAWQAYEFRGRPHPSAATR